MEWLLEPCQAVDNECFCSWLCADLCFSDCFGCIIYIYDMPS